MLYEAAAGIVKVIFNIVFCIKCEGRENIPKSGGAIVAVNHRSNLDPPMAAVYCTRHLRFMAKSELFKNKIFGSLISKLGAFPIERGRGDDGAIKGAFTILKNDEVLLMFPEGHRAKKGQQLKAQPGVAMIAHRTGVPVIPLKISGEYKFRKKIRLTFGEPIYIKGEKKMSAEELQLAAGNVLETIRNL